MRLAITGAAGFIGTHLLRYLSETDHEVLTIDRRPGAEHQRDVRDGIGDLLDSFKPDRVIHLAATYGILWCEEHQEDAIINNALVTRGLVRECANRGIKVVYTSTSEVYGADGSWSEGDPLPAPRNTYGMTKRWGEDVCRLHSNDPIILRLTMPYGPGVPPGPYRHALGNFVWRAHHRLPIEVHEGAARSWIWIDDLINGMMTVVEEAFTGTWNVGRDDDLITMKDLARRCCAIAGADPAELIHVVPLPAERTARKFLWTTRLQGLGWRPTVDLDEGLSYQLDWASQFDVDGRPLEEQPVRGGAT